MEFLKYHKGDHDRHREYHSGVSGGTMACVPSASMTGSSVRSPDCFWEFKKSILFPGSRSTSMPESAIVVFTYAIEYLPDKHTFVHLYGDL